MTMNDNENPLNSLVLPILIRPILQQVSCEKNIISLKFKFQLCNYSTSLPHTANSANFTFRPHVVARKARCSSGTNAPLSANESRTDKSWSRLRAGQGNHS